MYTETMSRIHRMEQQLKAIMEYLDINLVEKTGWEVIENKKEIGFCEKKKRV